MIRPMKTHPALAALVVFLASAGLVLAASRGSKSEQAVGLGVRSHALHSVFTDLPFDDGDLSYGLSYEFHEAAGYWQLAVDYCMDPTRMATGSVTTVAGRTTTNMVDMADSVITPQINLVFKDKIWRGGVGALSSYIEPADDSVDAEWSDIYYQFLLGAGIPLGRLGLDVLAVYPFDDWGNLGDFDTGDIDVQVWLKLSF